MNQMTEWNGRYRGDTNPPYQTETGFTHPAPPDGTGQTETTGGVHLTVLRDMKPASGRAAAAVKLETTPGTW